MGTIRKLPEASFRHDQEIDEIQKKPPPDPSSFSSVPKQIGPGSS